MKLAQRGASARASAPGSHWQPSEAQRDLLRAALLPDARAAAAWSRWRSAHAPDQALDPGSERLLPLVAHRLSQLGVTDDALLLRGRDARLRGRFKGILKVRCAAEWVRGLAALGVETLALKGLALAQRYYQDFGLRPMEDIDLLVRAAQVPAALAFLQARGLTPTEEIPRACWPPVPGARANLATAAVTHACGFVDPQARQLDLHWAALATHCSETADARFWQHALPLDLHGVQTLALHPAHELVHILAHGLRWNDVPSIRWIPDAATVIATTGAAMDWALFVAEIDLRGLALGVLPALELLETFDVPVPAHVTAALAALPVRTIDRMRLEHSLWPWDRPKPLRVIAFDAWRFCGGLPPGAVLARLGRYAWFRVAPDGRVASIPTRLAAKLIRGRYPGA